MRPPCEIVVRFLLPKLRAKVAEILIEEKGLSKKEVASLLGVSQASISKYKRILSEKSPIDSEMIEKYARDLAEMIVRGEDKERILLKVCSLCFLLRRGGSLCKYHREKEGIPECNICSEYFWIKEEYSEEEEILMKLNSALSEILKRPEFSRLIPEVRANIVMAKKDAKSSKDVAGIPGRITVVSGKPHAVHPPEFGASKHTSKILLEAMRFSDYRAAMCIKFDSQIMEAIKRAKLKYGKVSREKMSIEDFLNSFKRWGKIPEVVIDPGGPGIEPVAYVFGKDAEDVLKKVYKILEGLSKEGAPFS